MSYSEWRSVKLSDISFITMGQSPKSEFYNSHGDGVPFMQGRTTFGYKYHGIDTWCTKPTRMADKNSILMSVRAPVGDVNIATQDLCIGRGLAALNMKNGNNEFLYYLLLHEKQNLISRETGTVFGSINKAGLENLEITIPDDNEQRAIANILSSLDEKIELNNQMNETLEEMAQALFKRWFVDFEFPNEDGQPYKSSGGEMVESELGIIPKGWNIKKIIDISKQIGSGGTPSRKKVEYYGDEVLWLKTKELDDTYIFDTEEKITSIGLKESSAKIYPRNTIMIAMYGATVGKLGIISKELSFNQATCGIIVNDELPSHEYLFQWLKYNRDSIINLATGSAQQNLSVSVIKNIQLLCPNKNIVTLYKGLIEPIFKYKEKIQYENSSLKELRDTLLPKLMSGEIRVSDFES